MDLWGLPKDLVAGLGYIGQYLGVPSGNTYNAQGEVVYPTNALERFLQSNSADQTAIAASVVGPGGAPLKLSPALRYKDQVFTGLNHADALETAMKRLGPKSDVKYFQNTDEGFLNGEGKFLTRKEATDLVNDPRLQGYQLSHSDLKDLGIPPATMRSENLPAPESLWHGISQVKLPKPISEMSANIERLPVNEKRVTPAELQGGLLLPAMGDRSAASGILRGVGEQTFANPVDLQGGAGYMAANADRNAAWAAKQGVATGIQNKVDKLLQATEGKRPVYFPYTAMGERAVDFSHMPADTIVEMLPGSKITREARDAFNTAMKLPGKDFGPLEDWPGIGSNKLNEYLAQAPGYARSKFVKTMDKAAYQQTGFPSVAEARFAVTNPELLNAKAGDAGLAISKLNSDPVLGGSQHKTYETPIPGQYVGGFGTSVPRELMYPDMIKALEQYRANMPAGKMTPTIQYLMERTPKGYPIAQAANQQWVDTVSNFLRSKGLLSLAALGGASALAPPPADAPYFAP